MDDVSDETIDEVSAAVQAIKHAIVSSGLNDELIYAALGVVVADALRQHPDVTIPWVRRLLEEMTVR